MKLGRKANRKSGYIKTIKQSFIKSLIENCDTCSFFNFCVMSYLSIAENEHEYDLYDIFNGCERYRQSPGFPSLKDMEDMGSRDEMVLINQPANRRPRVCKREGVDENN